MATRTKTVEYAFPVLATMTDNTLTALTQITVYLPESPSGSAFKSVVANLSASYYISGATTSGNVTTRTLALSVNGVAATTVSNATVHTGSGEDLCEFYAADFTAQFVSNYTGTSKTVDVSVLLDHSAAITNWTNVCVTLAITYEYDDTVTTQVKTVRIPLDAPKTQLATTQPGSATATIPDLDADLPESTKTFRNAFITVQGNKHSASATDTTLSMRLDATATHTSQQFEGGSTADYWLRYVWECSSVLDTSISMSFYLWASVADHDHSQAWLTVTYEFDSTASTDVFVSLMIPSSLNGIMGGASGDYARATDNLWIPESGSITTKQIAFYSFWQQAAPITGLSMRVGTGSFVTGYTEVASQVCGGNGAMCRNDSAFSLARGKNTLSFDIYNTDATDLGTGLSGFWIVNYTASKPSNGYGAANHTVFHNLGAKYDSSPSTKRTLSAVAPTIADTNVFYSATPGVFYGYITQGSAQVTGASVFVERLAAEGGVQWERILNNSTSNTDPETGLYLSFSANGDVFQRWTGDTAPTNPSRINIETTRRWIVLQGFTTTVFHNLDLILNYHSMTATVSGDISGSAGGNVTIDLCLASTGEILLSTSRTGNGSYSFDWFGDGRDVYVVAYESSTLKGMSKEAVAGTGFDIALSPPTPITIWQG